MNDYIRIWRLLPKAVVGQGMFVVVLLAVGGVQAVSSSAQALRQFFAGIQSEFVAILVCSFLIATISTIGFQFACILLSLLNATSRMLIRILTRKSLGTDSVLVDLLSPISDIVRRTYQANSEFFIRHYALKSAGDEKLELTEAITAHFDKVRKHAENIRDWDVICTQAYQESLSQDQRKIDIMEEEIVIDASRLTVLIIAFPVMLFRFWVNGRGVAIGTGFTMLLLGIAGVYAHADLKRRLARFLIASYLDVFTVAEMTEYAEREGEQKI